MNTTRLLVLVFCLTISVGWAQSDSEPGWFSAEGHLIPVLAPGEKQQSSPTAAGGQRLGTLDAGETPSVAEVVTPEIQALARFGKRSSAHFQLCARPHPTCPLFRLQEGSATGTVRTERQRFRSIRAAGGLAPRPPSGSAAPPLVPFGSVCRNES